MFPYYTLKNLFFVEIIGKHFYLPNSFYIPIAIINVILIYNIAKKILDRKLANIALLIIIISPWFYYLSVAHSFYLFLLFPVLLIALGLVNIIKREGKSGNLFIILGSLISIYSSVHFLPLLTLIFIAIIFLKIVPFSSLKKPIIIILLFCLPLLFFANKNKIGFINSFKQESKIFLDPGLINSVNKYQGAAEANGLKIFSRISENKYLFYTEEILNKYLSQLVPETYFTPKYKLLNFSFSPPIFIGFLIPFFYGLYLSLKKPIIAKVLLVSTILTIPSVLAKDMVSLNRLILFSPVLFLIISYGLLEIYKNRKKIVFKNLLILTSILVIFQLLVTISDIKLRENSRFESYFGNNYEITQP